MEATFKEELASLEDSVVKLNFENAIKAAREAITRGASLIEVIESLRSGLNVVGDKFENGEYFLSELIVAGEIAKEVMEIIRTYMKEEKMKYYGKVVLATVEGDIHDIGKNLVNIMLTAAGFEVIDLGVDVPAEKIVQAVREHKPQIIGLSALLTSTMIKMEDVIKALEDAGLRGSVKVIVGGSPVTEEFAKKIGADYKAIDAVDGVDKCRQWLSG